MLLYKRPITSKLIWLKALLIALLAITTYSIWLHIQNLTYLTVVVFVFCSLIHFTGFNVWADKIVVTKYYFFGLLRHQWMLDRKAGITITAFGLPYGKEDDFTFAEGETAVGCVLSIILFFIPKPKITHKRFTLEGKPFAGGQVKTINLLLSEVEYYHTRQK